MGPRLGSVELEREANIRANRCSCRPARCRDCWLWWVEHNDRHQAGFPRNGDSDGDHDEDAGTGRAPSHLNLVSEPIRLCADPRARRNRSRLHGRVRGCRRLGVRRGQLPDRDLLSGRVLMHLVAALAERGVPLCQVCLRERDGDIRQRRLADAPLGYSPDSSLALSAARPSLAHRLTLV